MLNVPDTDSPAVLALPLEGKVHPLAMSVRDGRILLESTDVAGLRLEGGVTSRVFAGRTGAGRFELLQLRPVDGDRLEGHTGFYRTPDRRLLFLFPVSPLGIRHLMSCDDEGRLAAVYPVGDGEFVVGAGFLAPFPEHARIRFVAETGKAPTGLRWRESGLEHEAPRVALYDERPAEFRSGDVPLSGTLLLPRTPGRRPAVVLVHGSRDVDRYGTLMHAAFLLRYGVAVLAYDKRGVGRSGGDWRTASVPQLAGDVEEAVRWLKTRPEIDPGQIGLLGLSEGGWVAPLAATRSGDVAFVITLSGPAISPVELDMTNVRHELERQGTPRDEVERAIGLKRLSDHFARTGEGWDEFLAGVGGATGRPWGPMFSYAGAPPSREAWYWRYWRGMMDYDPLSALRVLRSPVLAIFGQFDTTVRPDVNTPLWRKALEEAGNRQASLVVLPRANHALLEVERGEVREIADATGFPPGLQSTILEWLRPRIALVPPTP
jgi:dipeptidyl aminopeptidase/acylaminoacyl peptidase